MNRLGIVSMITLVLGIGTQLQARDFVGAPSINPNNPPTGHRAACIESRAQTDLDINNVRARLRAGGDMWYDGVSTARYVVPNVDPASGKPEISSLFAGAIWLGGYDDGGNLILAGQTYRSSGNDFWNGPLDPLTGTIEKSDCEKWDRHFEVLGSDIDLLRADFLEIDPATGEADHTIDTKPSKGILGWPGRGNPYFAEIYAFELPDQDLAPFVDFNSDGVYDPYDGDHPVIEVAGCSADYYTPVYADQMIWWVYNDNGNIHTQTNGQPMIMEVQVTAFGYRTTDAINNMTFYRYKLLNRNALSLKDTYFSLWSDPDLGCSADDYIGCDTITGLGYVYNADNDDNVTCGQGQNGYGSTIPALGVDYFRGPLDSAGNEIGLSSFQYHLNSNTPIGDPNSALGYYRLISGSWPDGTPITAGGNGYDNPNGATTSTPYVFYSWPNETAPGSWSMCNNPSFPGGGGDFRFLHTSGPFVLKAGATNEMISGVVWVPELPDYPCPSMKGLVQADELAQNLFDDCFKITDGPDAPFIDVVELENELILNLSYTPAQNNYKLQYEESPAKLREFDDTTYQFQGYQVYQVKNENTSVTELNDPEKARLIYQCDMLDDVSQIVNWAPFPDENIQAFIPTIMVNGENKGIKHTFRVKEDKFTSSGNLVNHKPYYFCVVAYGFNEYLKYDPADNTGQADSYLQGRRNFRIYTGIPRNNSPEYYGAVINAEYGDRPQITRIDGKGNGGGLFLDVADRAAFETEMFTNGKVDRITYIETGGPLDIRVVDPLRVAPGTFRLYICDELFVWNKQVIGDNTTYTPMPPVGNAALGDGVGTDSIYWALTNANDPTEFWASFKTMDVKNEQYIPELGISLTIRQASTPGTDGTSGFIGSTMEYTDKTAVPWYTAIEDASAGLFNVLKTGNSQPDAALDPEQTYSTSAGGWYPFSLCDCRLSDYYFTPGKIDGSYCGQAWRESYPEKILAKQRNVNVVMTPNKDLWSRCPVVETASKFHKDIAYLGLTVPGGDQFTLRTSPSVDKNGDVIPGETGFSWFPGYAYDVETGERLNVFFGENSFFNGSFFTEADVPGSSTGNDMIYNPTNVANITPDEFLGFLDAPQAFLSSVYGGHHYIYVASSPYDEGAKVISYYTAPLSPLAGGDHTFPMFTVNGVIWSSMSYLLPGQYMNGAKGNIPPSEVVFKLRVETPYEIYSATGDNNNYPLYEFSMEQYVPTKEGAEAAVSALDLINIVPNPYYCYSDYEVTEIENVIKITNLPPRCDIKIFSLDGRFIKAYNISQEYPNEVKNGISRLGLNGSPDIENQIVTSIEWDVKNQARVPVGSGVYLVHVIAKDINGNPIGERVLKSFIINRAFDPQKL